MRRYLKIAIRFLQPRYHGRDEHDAPEWPPSPLRVMQALVAAAAGRDNERRTIVGSRAVFEWLETLGAPLILGPRPLGIETPYRLYVPDNVGNLVISAWARGGASSVADYRTEKDVSAVRLGGDLVEYLYRVDRDDSEVESRTRRLADVALALTHVGWGIDQAMARVELHDGPLSPDESQIVWKPVREGGRSLRVPKAGTFGELARRHEQFLDRIGHEGLVPVPPLGRFSRQAYRSSDEGPTRIFQAFEMRRFDGRRFRYPHRQLIHIAGMVRHLAIEAMRRAPPAGCDPSWIERVVAGHRSRDAELHDQFSYLPLPSVGHAHADPGVRRLLIVAPEGERANLKHLVRYLAGATLRPEPGRSVVSGDSPLLVPIRADSVVARYVRPSAVWHSFTPVILPGHDDHRPEKTERLILKALRQSGIDVPCEFEWSSFSRFAKSYSAHRYDRRGPERGEIGYVRPSYLKDLTGVHLTLRFHDGSPERRAIDVPGPIAIGAGRHCGLGIMVGEVDHQRRREVGSKTVAEEESDSGAESESSDE